MCLVVLDLMIRLATSQISDNDRKAGSPKLGTGHADVTALPVGSSGAGLHAETTHRGSGTGTRNRFAYRRHRSMFQISGRGRVV